MIETILALLDREVDVAQHLGGLAAAHEALVDVIDALETGVAA